MNSWYLLISIVGFAIGFVLKNSTELAICLVSEPTCINNLTWIGNGLFYGMGALAVVFLVLHLVPQAFGAWKKFAIWFVPLAALLFIFYPEPGAGDYFSPYPETVFRVISATYVLICFAIVGWSVRK